MSTTTEVPASPKPAVMTVHAEVIPAELRAVPRWLGWKWKPKEKGSGWTKPPFSVKTGKQCAKNDPSAWVPFDEAYRAHRLKRFDGIGFEFEAVDELAGIDLDDCRDPATGELTEFAKYIIAWANSYGEVSPSGCGVKVFVRGKLPWGNHADHGRGVEMYEAGSYFCVTGRHVDGTPQTIRDVSGCILDLSMFAFGVDEQGRAWSNNSGLSDAEIARSALAGLNASRADDYLDWIRVGAALQSVDDSLLADWDAWSQSSSKYVAGDCAKRWATFSADGPTGKRAATIGSLIYLAKQDTGWTHPRPTANAKPRGSKTKTADAEYDFHLTDLGNAKRLVAQHGADIRYCFPWQKWLHWDGWRWATDDTGAVERLAKDTVRNLWHEAADAPDPTMREKLAKFASASESQQRIRAMIELARSEEGIPILPEVLDSNPWLLNCENGTVDLKTGRRLPHNKRDLITKICPVVFDPDAKAPLWESFLHRIFDGNGRLIGFVQRLAGYALTGEVREHILPIFHGSGANGKSVFMNTMLNLLGSDYATEAPPDMMMARSSERHPTELASLHGKRLVATIETAQGRRLNEALVKSLTGGDMLTARRMREDFWSFRPTHKLIVATNHRPGVSETGHAMWRRLKLVPFDVVIPDKEQDHGLTGKLRDEYPGILAWAVRGCLDYIAHGLGEPPEVVEATAAYRDSEDSLGQFLSECCVIDRALRTKAAQLLEAYREWSGSKITQTKLGAMLTERGFRRHKSSVCWWLGVGLASSTSHDWDG